MIIINLLPEEYLRARRKPAQTLAVLGTVAAVNVALLLWLASLFFGSKSRIMGELGVLESDMASLTPQLAYHDDLEKENKQFQSREETLREITLGRVSWTEKVDQLVDVINHGGEGEKYLVWLNDLKVVQAVQSSSKSKTPQSGGTFRATGYSGSPNFGLVANFFEDLTESDFAGGFLPPAPPQGRREAKDEGLIPSEIFSFTLDLQLAPPEVRKK
ncbi:MAG: hypothetical protein R3F34_11825 [Planctomycetota bacterium]